MNLSGKLSSMSLEERAGQLVMSSFVGREEIPSDTIELLEKGAVGSMLYFSGCNVVDSLQLRSLTEKVQEASLKSPHQIPQFIAIDQEGGQLAPITKKISIGPGNMALGAIRNNGEDHAYSMGNITGKELKAQGIDVCFAPVVDLCFEDGLPVKDNRYFGSDPEKAARLASAFTRGLQDAGVLACAKHFPGQRNVDIDSHFELDTVPHSFERLMSHEWIPFKAAIDAGVGMMMTLHASFPELDPSKTPATLSKPILQKYLRGKLNFKGLIVTDDIQMKPIRDTYGIGGAMVKAIEAGVNIIIVSGGVNDANIQIADAVRRGELSEEALNAACLKVLEFKEKYVNACVPSEKEAEKICGCKEHTEIVQKAADASITLLRNNDKLLPLPKLDPSKRFAVLRPSFGRLMMSDNTNFFTHNMKDIFSNYFPNVSEYVFGLDPSEPEILGATDWAFMADYVLICTYNAYQHPKQLELLEKCFAFSGNAKTIIAALRSPQDLHCITDEKASLLSVYGVSECSLHALAKAIAGITVPNGVLPVGVAKDENYHNGTLKEGAGLTKY